MRLPDNGSAGISVLVCQPLTTRNRVLRMKLHSGEVTVHSLLRDVGVALAIQNVSQHRIKRIDHQTCSSVASVYCKSSIRYEPRGIIGSPLTVLRLCCCGVPEFRRLYKKGN